MLLLLYLSLFLSLFLILNTLQSICNGLVWFSFLSRFVEDGLQFGFGALQFCDLCFLFFLLFSLQFCFLLFLGFFFCLLLLSFLLLDFLLELLIGQCLLNKLVLVLNHGSDRAEALEIVTRLLLFLLFLLLFCSLLTENLS